MRLSELSGVLFQLQQIAHKRGNFDPIVEMFHDDLYMDLNLLAIANDPEGQLLANGTIHLPMKEIVQWGYVVKYYNEDGEASITINAESKDQAEKIFKKHFSSYGLKSITEEV